MIKRRALIALIVPALLLALTPLPPAFAIDPAADLGITITDGASYYVPSGTLTYTIVVTNAGPDTALGALVADTFPAELTSVSWTAVFAGGAVGTASGTGNISQYVDLPAASTVTYTVTATVSSTATGTLANTATIAGPVSPVDPNPGNNTSTDTDAPSVDLQVEWRDNSLTYTPGLASVFTLTVTNAGNESVVGAFCETQFSEQVSTVQWQAVFTPGSTGETNGLGDVGNYVDLAPGGTVTYTVTANTYPDAINSLLSSASVSQPPGTYDSKSSNNQWIDIDAPLRFADLGITKDDGVASWIPGMSTIYTLIVHNNGPTIASGARVTDDLPDGVTSASWSAVFEGAGSTGSTSGLGDIDESVTLSAEGTATYTITAFLEPDATGNITNTARVAAPFGTIDVNPTDNTASDCDVATPQVDLAITKDDGTGTYTPGRSTTYTVTVLNNGPSALVGGTLVDDLPPVVAGATWSAVYSEGSSGDAAGTGDLNASIDLAVGGSATFTIVAPISAGASGDLVNVAQVYVPTGTTNLNPVTAATDVDVAAPSADLRVYKTDLTSQYVPGSPLTYSITVANFGPSDISGAQVIDTLPVMLGTASWTASFASGSGATSGTGNINELIDLAAGGSVTYTVSALVLQTASGDLVNTATVVPPAGVTDPEPSNNSSTDVDTSWNADINAIYRFYNTRAGTHFYTATASERDYVIATWPTIYRYEGVAYHAPSAPGTIPLYRFYNRRTGTHFYTASEEEKQRTIASMSGTFGYEGVAYQVLPSPTAGSVPVYRFFNRVTGAHFYTAGESERLNVIASFSWYLYEGVAFYVAP